MPEVISEGHCVFCNKVFKKSGINRHLNTHFESKAKTGTEAGRSFHLRVEQSPNSGGKGLWFLNLWVKDSTTFTTLDRFLRDIWLECCGHLSVFSVPASNVEISKKKTMAEIFTGHEKLTYQYDFESTTELQISVVAAFPIAATEKIVLLSRNAPLAVMCSTCGKEPAEEICTVCSKSRVASFCAECAVKHAEECKDFGDYTALPIVNSPRVGVCAYEGGVIDVERDGVYKKCTPAPPDLLHSSRPPLS